MANFMIGLPIIKGNSHTIVSEDLQGADVLEGRALQSIEMGVVGEVAVGSDIYGFKVAQTIGGSAQIVLSGLIIGLPSESDLSANDPVFINPLTGLITAAGTADAIEVPRAVVREGGVDIYDSEGLKVNDDSLIYGVTIDLGVYK